jgi:general secretion pathway protein N
MIKWVLAVIALALGGLLYLQWSDWPPPAVVPLTPAVPGATRAAGDPDPLVGLGPLEAMDDYAAIKDRPLFRPDRRPRVDEPGEATAEPPPEEAAKLDGMDLAGVLLSPGIAMAWVKDPSQPAPLRVRLGETLAGWTVKDIQADRLVLERQGATDTLPLRTFNAPWASPPPPPMPPPAAKQSPPGKPQEGKGSEKPAAPGMPASPAAKQRTVRPPPTATSTVPPGSAAPRAARPRPPAANPR